MNRIFLRPCIINDAREHFLNGVPISFNSMQTSDFKLEDGNTPSIGRYEQLENSFTLDGSLLCQRGDNEIIVANWLERNLDGPYYFKNNSDVFYFLGGWHDKIGYYWMQICSDPMNFLSEDCVDELLIWIKAD